MRLFNKQFLASNLCFMHGIIVASAPLLRLAISRSKGAVCEYYKKHLDEEKGHDAMLRKDLMQFCAQIPLFHAAAQIAGSQYYFIRHVNPALLLGYMLTLESNTLPMKTVTQLENVHGVKLTCMRHHSEHDPFHAAEIRKVIATLDEDLQLKIKWNADCVLHSLNVTIDAIWEQSQKQERAHG